MIAIRSAAFVAFLAILTSQHGLLNVALATLLASVAIEYIDTLTRHPA